MTDHEPVNIMGVFAFPNPDRDNRMIRFIDSEYNTLFTVKDGERIVLTNLDDQTEILACTYIDDCHTKIGSTTFHIRQFAEIQENYGIRYMPCEPKPEDMVDTYEIYRAVIGNAGGGVVLTRGGKKTAYYADVDGFHEAPDFLMQPQKVRNRRKDRGESR